MTGNAEIGSKRRGNRFRVARWGAAAVLLLLPLVAMQFTEEVHWDLADFAVFGAMLAAACGAYELATRATGDVSYRAAVGVAVGAAFILIWLSLGVGIIGRDGGPVNLIYFGVLGVGVTGAVIARFRPHGMARALIATAIAQTSVAVIALVAGLGRPWSGPLKLSLLTGLFVAMFVGSAWLFHRAAPGPPERGAA